MNLLTIKDLLVDNGIEAIFQPANETMVLSRVVSRLASEENPKLTAEMVYLPLEGEAEAIKLLQVFVKFPYVISANRLNDVRILLNHLNLYLPLPAFSYHETEGYVYYKYIATIPQGDFENQRDYFLEMFYLYSYLIDTYYIFILQVAIGGMSLKEAINETNPNLG